MINAAMELRCCLGAWGKTYAGDWFDRHCEEIGGGKKRGKAATDSLV